MDQNFQTSFIPKKPIVEEQMTSSQPIGILLIAAIFIFVIVLLGTGGIYFYKNTLNNKILSMQTSLDNAKNSFEPSKIAELKLLDKRLSAATTILNNHIAVTPIFTELGNITMHSVRYNQFSYSLNQNTKSNGSVGSSVVNVKMSGVATDYRSIALEADLFAQDKNFTNPVFSNLVVDTSGNITFDLTFSVAPSFVNYKQGITAAQS